MPLKLRVYLFVLGLLSIALPLMAELTYRDHDAQLARIAIAASNATGNSTEKSTITIPLFPVWFSAAMDWYVMWDSNTVFELRFYSSWIARDPISSLTSPMVPIAKQGLDRNADSWRISHAKARCNCERCRRAQRNHPQSSRCFRS